MMLSTHKETYEEIVWTFKAVLLCGLQASLESLNTIFSPLLDVTNKVSGSPYDGDTLEQMEWCCGRQSPEGAEQQTWMLEVTQNIFPASSSHVWCTRCRLNLFGLYEGSSGSNHPECFVESVAICSRLFSKFMMCLVGVAALGKPEKNEEIEENWTLPGETNDQQFNACGPLPPPCCFLMITVYSWSFDNHDLDAFDQGSVSGLCQAFWERNYNNDSE